jgi:hypothetical protein
MVDSTTTMVRSWESRIEGDGGMAGINIDLELRSKLISRYYIKSLFWKQLHQRRRNILEAENSSRCDVMSRGFIGIPGSRYDLFQT